MRAATDGARIINRNVDGTTPPVERLCQFTIAEIKNTKNNVSFSVSKNVGRTGHRTVFCLLTLLISALVERSTAHPQVSSLVQNSACGKSTRSPSRIISFMAKWGQCDGKVEINNQKSHYVSNGSAHQATRTMTVGTRDNRQGWTTRSSRKGRSTT